MVRGAVLLIGSLLWDDDHERRTWREARLQTEDNRLSAYQSRMVGKATPVVRRVRPGAHRGIAPRPTAPCR